jgi:glycerophosphoryl diester phosphodiesterase
MNDALVAHRGEPESLPENSLEGFRAVLEAGATWLETDIQLTAEGIPVLSHDGSLLKLTGHDLPVPRTRWADMQDLPAGHPDRFGERYAHLRIALLADFVALLRDWPQAQAFIEIKQESLDVFGVAAVTEAVLKLLEPVRRQCIVISFNADVVQHARGHLRTGWVLGDWSKASRAQAEQLAPDFLFVSRKRLPPDGDKLWEGPWQWAVYTVNEEINVAAYLARGIDLVETNRIRSLLHCAALTGSRRA